MDDFAKYEQVHSEVNTRNGIKISGHQFLTGCELVSKGKKAYALLRDIFGNLIQA